MVISHSKKFIFIHNQKVAGTSLTSELVKYGLEDAPHSVELAKLLEKTPELPAKATKSLLRRMGVIECFTFHETASSIKKNLGEKIYNDYYTFGLVRNPWDWQVSLYSYMKQLKSHYQHDLINNMANFNEYIKWRVENEPVTQRKMFYENGVQIVDYIGKFEELENVFLHLNQQLGLNLKAVHKNNSKHKDYRSYYNSDTWDMVANAYKEDIEILGYK